MSPRNCGTTTRPPLLRSQAHLEHPGMRHASRGLEHREAECIEHMWLHLFHDRYPMRFAMDWNALQRPIVRSIELRKTQNDGERVSGEATVAVAASHPEVAASGVRRPTDGRRTAAAGPDQWPWLPTTGAAGRAPRSTVPDAAASTAAWRRRRRLVCRRWRCLCPCRGVPGARTAMRMTGLQLLSGCQCRV